MTQSPFLRELDPWLAEEVLDALESLAADPSTLITDRQGEAVHDSNVVPAQIATSFSFVSIATTSKNGLRCLGSARGCGLGRVAKTIDYSIEFEASTTFDSPSFSRSK